MNPLTQVFPWLSWGVVAFMVGTVAASVGIGFYLGITSRRNKELQDGDRLRKKTLRMLSEVVSATERLTTDVEHHTTEIQGAGYEIEHIKTEGELERVQEALLTQVSAVLKSNEQLEGDLCYTRLKMQEQSQEIDQVRRESRTDALSGIPNRKAFDERMELLLTELRRTGKTFCLVLADIDHFKWINDTHGHPAGDRVVEKLGALLRTCMGEKDMAARYGGDEFAILLVGVDAASAMQISEDIRSQVSTQNFGVDRGEDEVAVTFSMGVAQSWPEATAKELIDRADKALYRSKHGGRNRVSGWQEEDAEAPVPQWT